MTQATVLIVEDDAVLAIHLKDLLVRQGYAVLTPISSGEEAIRAVQALNPSIILMDIELAGQMSGISAAEQIGAVTDIPVIFLTGYSHDPLLQQAKITAPYGYLVKPVPERELAGTIEIALYRYKLDHQVKESEARYRGLIEQAFDGIFLSDQSGYYSEVNPAGCAMLGYSREEILKLNMRDLITPEGLVNVPVRTAEMLKGATVRSERLFRRKDGTIFPVEISGKMLENGNLQGIVRDITERKRMEHTLQESEPRLVQAQAMAHVGNWEIDLLENSIWASADAFRIYGLERTSPYLALEQIQQIPIAEDRPRMDAALSALLHKQSPYDIEFRIQHANEANRHVIHSIANLVCNAQGAPVKVIGVLQDITEQKKIEEDLRASETHYRSLFENILEGYSYSQMLYENANPVDFIYLKVNQAFEELTGLKNVIGRRVSEVIPGIRELDPGLIEIYGRVALTGKPEVFEMYINSLKDWYSISVYSTESDYFVVIFDVITKRKQAELQLNEQLEELRRWNAVTLGREMRILELKGEVNELLARIGELPRYANPEGTAHGSSQNEDGSSQNEGRLTEVRE